MFTVFSWLLTLKDSNTSTLPTIVIKLTMADTVAMVIISQTLWGAAWTCDVLAKELFGGSTPMVLCYMSPLTGQRDVLICGSIKSFPEIKRRTLIRHNSVIVLSFSFSYIRINPRYFLSFLSFLRSQNVLSYRLKCCSSRLVISSFKCV